MYHQGLSQPKIFTHRQWPLRKPNKTYQPPSPIKCYYTHVYHIYMLKIYMKWFNTNTDSLFPGFFLYFFYEYYSCTKIVAIEAISFTAKCRKSVWPYMKRMVNKQKAKIRQKHWMSESGSMLHYRNKNRYEKLFCRFPHVMHSKSTSSPCTSLNYRLAFLGSTWLAHVFTKQNSHQVPESGDTFQQSAFLRQFTIIWRILQSNNLPISCFKT